MIWIRQFQQKRLKMINGEEEGKLQWVPAVYLLCILSERMENSRFQIAAITSHSAPACPQLYECDGVCALQKGSVYDCETSVFMRTYSISTVCNLPSLELCVVKLRKLRIHKIITTSFGCCQVGLGKKMSKTFKNPETAILLALLDGFRLNTCKFTIVLLFLLSSVHSWILRVGFLRQNCHLLTVLFLQTGVSNTHTRIQPVSAYMYM